ncbi:MAG: hypothetical protein IH945_03615 [Armatimonadetes bacterium]|nr:hypothetical protein [Armatimonadota bacterium]
MAVAASAVVAAVQADARPIANDPPQEQFAEWISAYKSWGFPLPPKGSKLYKYPVGTAEWGQRYGLVIVSTDTGQGSQYFAGVSVTTEAEIEGLIPVITIEQIEQDTWSVYDLQSGYDLRVCWLDYYLAIGLQLIHLGETQLGLKILDRRDPAGMIHLPYDVPYDVGIETRIAYLAFQYRLNEWHDIGISRAQTAKNIRKVLDTGLLQLSEYQESSLEGMFASAKTSTAGLRGLQRDIENLLDAKIDEKNLWMHEDWPVAELARITDQGLSALPVLAEYLDDERWARAIDPPFFTMGASYFTLGELATAAVRIISKGQAGTTTENSSKEAVLAFYSATSNEDVYEYWMRLLAMEDENNRWESQLQMGGQVFSQFSELYPEDAVRIYLDIVANDPAAHTGNMSYDIAKTELPLETKVDAFKQALESPTVHHRYPALSQLAEISPADVVVPLRSELELIPVERMATRDRSAVGIMAKLTTAFRDKELWASVHRALKRCDKLTRATIIRVLTEWIWKEDRRNFDLSIRAIVPYIDDASRLTAEEAFEMGWRFGRNPWFTIGDFAVLEIGAALYAQEHGLQPIDSGNPFYYYSQLTPEGMARFREQVTAELREKGYLK